MFRIIPGGRDFREYVLMRDGESVLMRTAAGEDVSAVEALLQGVSRESLRMRFMGSVSYVPRTIIEQMCMGDPLDRFSLLAVVGPEPGARVVGIGSYAAIGLGGRAEVAFLVKDEYQGRGISTLLLDRLAGIAAGNGFTGFEAEVLSENQAMINVFRDSGFELHQAGVEGGSVHLEFPTGGAAAMRERAELRDRIAEASSLIPLLAPKAAAVVGASRDPEAVGSMIFRAILRGNFNGAVYPVNNQASSVLGVHAFASVRDLPEAPELVVIAVPADNVLGVAEEALQAGARGLLVVSSGFAESGAEGSALQKKLVDLVRSRGARLIGPNCLGVMNTHPDVSLNASLASQLAPRGRIGFFSHSAALGLVILEYAAERGLGFSSFVSAGNRADVSGNDLLQFWEEDSSTDVALLYLETFGNPRRFARVARRLSYRKPILCVKSARSRAGLDLARAHIGAPAGGSNVAESETNVETLFRQAGVIRADTLEEMFDVAVLLSSQPLPRGNRTSIISNSGGVLTICADACEGRGLALAGPGLVDLGTLATLKEYENAVGRAIQHEDVDALIVIFACVGNCDPQAVGRAIRRGVRRGEAESGVSKPVLLCLMGAARAVQFGGQVFPSYRFPESAAMALSRAAQYAAFRSRPAGRLLWYEDIRAGEARQSISAVLSAVPGETVEVEGERAAGLLRSFGISLRAAGEAEPSGERASLEVRSDRSFGPLIRLLRDREVSAVRITPLTDHDAREIVEAAGLPPGVGVEELLGRTSQLIEEMPWLLRMDAAIECPPAGSGGAARFGPGVRFGFSSRR